MNPESCQCRELERRVEILTAAAHDQARLRADFEQLVTIVRGLGVAFSHVATATRPLRTLQPLDKKAKQD